jgi:hypothetical protein
MKKIKNIKQKGGNANEIFKQLISYIETGYLIARNRITPILYNIKKQESALHYLPRNILPYISAFFFIFVYLYELVKDWVIIGDIFISIKNFFKNIVPFEVINSFYILFSVTLTFIIFYYSLEYISFLFERSGYGLKNIILSIIVIFISISINLVNLLSYIYHQSLLSLFIENIYSDDYKNNKLYDTDIYLQNCVLIMAFVFILFIFIFYILQIKIHEKRNPDINISVFLMILIIYFVFFYLLQTYGLQFIKNKLIEPFKNDTDDDCNNTKKTFSIIIAIIIHIIGISIVIIQKNIKMSDQLNASTVMLFEKLLNSLSLEKEAQVIHSNVK